MEAFGGLFSLADKRDEPGLNAAAQTLGLDLTFLSREALAAATPRLLTRSAAAQSRFGLASVAEAAALAGAGPACEIAGAAPRRQWRDLRDRLRPGDEPGHVRMTVHFIGAGPGAADLITLRGRDLLARCPVCLYAGSLVSQACCAHCPPGARIVDTAAMDLDQIVAEFVAAHGERLRRRAAAFGRSVDLERDGRTIAAARRAGDSLHDHARRSRLRRRRGGARQGADAAGNRAIAGADAHVGPRFRDAGARETCRPSPRPARPWRSICRSMFSISSSPISFPITARDCPVAIVYRASWPEERILRGDARRHRGAGEGDDDRAQRA